MGNSYNRPSVEISAAGCETFRGKPSQIGLCLLLEKRAERQAPDRFELAFAALSQSADRFPARGLVM
jgi:hypothetical protein